MGIGGAAPIHGCVPVIRGTTLIKSMYTYVEKICLRGIGRLCLRHGTKKNPVSY
jgi:hypothetical protein